MYFSFESKCKYMEESEFVCDSPHVNNEVDKVWLRTQLPVVRDVWWRTQLPGVHETGAMQKGYNISCVI